MRFTYLISLLVVWFAAPVAWGSEQQAAVRQGASNSGWSLLTIAAAAITLFALIALTLFVRRFLRRRAERAKNDPGQLLRELCQAHGLSRRAERLLRKAAVAVGTPHPGRFFLEPQLLRQAEECGELKKSRRTIRLLYDQLFGDDAG